MKQEVDYKNVELTKEEKEEGWKIRTCRGNTYRTGCGKQYRELNWHTPSGCPHCPVSFVD